MSRFALLIAALPLLATGCVDQTLQALEPAFSIAWPTDDGYVQGDLSTSVLRFGELDTGTFDDIQITIANPGDASLEVCALHLAEIAFDGAGAPINELVILADPEITTSPLPALGPMPPGATASFQVRYIPLQEGALSAGTHLVVRHALNAECGGDPEPTVGLLIPIVGSAVGMAVPDIYAKPQQVDFGTVLLDVEVPPSDVLIGNQGPGQLDITAVSLSDYTHFSIDTQSLPGSEFAQGEHGFVTVTYDPQHQGSHSSAILVQSSDPNQPTFSVPLFGVANPEEVDDPPPGDDDDATPGDDDDDVPPPGFPIAMCGSTVFANPFEVVTLNSFSFHTGGIAETLALQHSWNLTVPPGSATTLSGATTANPTTDPYVDLVGTYVGHLTITDSGGATDTCDQTIEVLPQENFRVELFWDEEDDFDLHLLEANDGTGAQGSTWSDGDCHFANCQSLGLDWGVSGDIYDNPYLDLDDIPGYGPENINITDPALAPYEGWYRIMVHDYTGSTEDNYGTTNGTVNIYLNNVLVQTYGFSMTDDGDEYWVAEIEWPSGQVVACNGLGGCPY